MNLTRKRRLAEGASPDSANGNSNNSSAQHLDLAASPEDNEEVACAFSRF